MCRFLIAASDPAFIRELQLRLKSQPGLECVGAVESRAEAVRILRSARPDTLILRTEILEAGWVSCLREVAGRHAEGTFLLRLHEPVEYAEHPSVVASGSAYFLKEPSLAGLQVLLRGIHGMTCGSPIEAGRRRPRQRSAHRPPDALGLSLRERQVLNLIVQGRTSKEIAHLLDISPRTVDAHRASLMKKLDIHSIAGLVHYALRHPATYLDA